MGLSVLVFGINNFGFVVMNTATRYLFIRVWANTLFKIASCKGEHLATGDTLKMMKQY